MIAQKEYWNKRFKDGKLWGDQPCPSAIKAIPYLEENNSVNILVPGCGYGRNSSYFAEKGYEVTGVDVSDEAIKFALADINKNIKNLSYLVEDIFSLTSIDKQYDAVFLSNVIHLFLGQDRAELVKVMETMVAPNGLFIFTAISATDPKNFGVGQEVEQNTFLHNDKTLHFYSEEEVKNMLSKDFNILDQSLHIQTEIDPLGNEEDLILWFVVAKRNIDPIISE